MVFALAKDYPSLKNKIIELLESQIESKVKQNEQIGRTAAMKAHKRMIEERSSYISKLLKR